MKKKVLRKEIKRLAKEFDALRSAHNYAVNNVKKDRDEWRKKYELLLHTPEYKADTEAAFNRGVDATRMKFKAWLLQGAQDIKVENES